jgi:hypothetical protein
LTVEQLGVRTVRQQSPANKIAEFSRFIAIENWFAGRGFAYPPAAVKIFRAKIISSKGVIFMDNKELRILILETRKRLLENRGGNQPILNKINRQLRRLKGE